jgi:DNA-directed RNA polymerase specialized sigma24 family protein
LGVLDTLEARFRMLCRGPEPLTLPGGMFTAGRRRPVRLVEARELLLWPGRMDHDSRDRVWTELVRRAQADRATGTGSDAAAWVVAAAGVLGPGLRRVIDRLTTGWAGDRDDLEAEVVVGFLTALQTIDSDSGRLASRLCWAAYRAGLALRRRQTEESRRRAVGVEVSTPARRCGHPDFVLAAAVRAGTLTSAEADLVGATRLEGHPLDRAAAELGISRGTLLTRRSRAERRLAAAIRTGTLATTTATGSRNSQ